MTLEEKIAQVKENIARAAREAGRDPAEVTHFAGVQTAPEGIRVCNPAFDVTPHKLLTGIVTEKTRYPLDEQIRRCIALQERAWLEKDIDIEGELAPVTFYGSEDLVEHIWSNLISNAIRFTPPGGQISVVLRQEGGEVCVTVSDTGCGMDEQTQAHIFDKFYKGAAQQSPGNGLGLAIVRRAVELCGGSIRVASSPGCGSSFFVTLPSADG